MKRIAPLLLLLAACGGGGDAATTTTSGAPATTTTVYVPGDDEPEPTTTTEAAVTTTGAPATDTLGFYSVLFTGGMVMLFNGSATDVDLTGYGLCQGGTCAGFPAITLPAGQYLSINVGADLFFPVPGSVSIAEVLDIGGIDAAGGEVALLDAGAQVVSYVAWGSAPPAGYFDLAVGAGVWASDWLVNTTAETTAITYFPGIGTSDETGWSTF
jgi:hypothetical protein